MVHCNIPTWTVSEDWEARTWLANDIFRVQTTHGKSTYSGLWTPRQFAKEKVFLEIIDSLMKLHHGKSLKALKRAKHKAKGYTMEDGWLWKVGDGSVRARARLEC